jgi:type IV secretion system protein VirB1
MDLLSLAALCGPLVHPEMTLRVIAVESQGHAYAVHDNTTARRYYPETLHEAVRLSSDLIASGHRLDLGLMQINYEAWLRSTAFPIERALDPCTNITLGTTILSANYTQALMRSTTMNEALLRCLSLYNSGSEWRSLAYAQVVLTGHVSSAALPPHGSSSSAERARNAAVTFSVSP